jgi:hypothetical protein
MRTLMLTAAMLAGLSLAACGKQTSQADATPAPEKSLAHQAQMYQGQDQVHSVQTATVEPNKSGGVVLKAEAMVAGPGYQNPGFLPRIYAATPPDGIYEVDVVADKPAAAGAAAATPIEAKGDWSKYTDGRVKGIKFISKTNSVVAMLQPGPAKVASK